MPTLTSPTGNGQPRQELGRRRQVNLEVQALPISWDQTYSLPNWDFLGNQKVKWIFYNLRTRRWATGPPRSHPGAWEDLLALRLWVLHTLERRVRDRKGGKTKCFDCAESYPFNTAIKYKLTFFPLILEQIYFVAAILSSLPLSRFLFSGKRDRQFLGSVYWFLSPQYGANFQLCVRPLLWGFFPSFFLQLLLKKKKTNCIELYTLSISGLWVHYPSMLCNLFWNNSHSFSLGFPGPGREHGMKSWSFQSLLMRR